MFINGKRPSSFHLDPVQRVERSRFNKQETHGLIHKRFEEKSNSHPTNEMRFFIKIITKHPLFWGSTMPSRYLPLTLHIFIVAYEEIN